MEPLIRVDLEKVLADAAPVILDLGCGRKRVPGRITIDKVDLPQVDIVADLEEGLAFLPDECADAIHCRSVLEHIENFEPLLREMMRVLKPEGTAHVFVPHFSNPYYYSDPTHRRFFGLYSFYYFVDADRQLKRKVPTFYSDIRLEVVSLRLVFRSPFWGRRRLKKLFGVLFNLHPWFQEWYEEMLCYLLPCDGIEVVLRRGECAASGNRLPQSPDAACS